MPSIVGSQYTFSAPAGDAINVVYSPDGTNLPAPVSGDVNLEVITSPTGTSYPLPSGYQAVALLPGGTGQALQLLLGNIGVTDSGTGNVITAGSGNDTIVGASGDTIIGGTGSDSIDVSAGNQIVALGSGPATVSGGASDTIVLGTGSALINFGATNEAVADNGNAGGRNTVTGFSQADGDSILIPQGDLPTAVVATAETAGGNTTITFADGSNLTLVGINNVNTSFFATTPANIPCFRQGTLIKTEHGQVPVEDLAIGDAITLLDGTVTKIEWIGHRRLDATRHPKPSKVWPVRIAAGAFGAGQPHRDLFLSPDHAVFVNEVLIPVKHLINGGTIAQVPMDSIAYFHIELPHHDIILAEGLTVESYLDAGDRNNFDNAGGLVGLFPDFSFLRFDNAQIWDAYACAPLIVCGPQLDAARRRVNELPDSATNVAVA